MFWLTANVQVEYLTNFKFSSKNIISALQNYESPNALRIIFLIIEN